MSITNDIRLLIDIQDSNVIFDHDFFQMETFKGKNCKFIKGKLSYTPTHCDACGIENHNYIIYKNGTQTSRITLPFLGMYPAYLLLKKQRFMCKACQHSFTAQTSVVKKNCFISQNIKTLVVIKATEARSIKSIARDSSVSSPTVQRIINEAAKEVKPHYQALPQHLSFDEFKYAIVSISIKRHLMEFLEGSKINIETVSWIGVISVLFIIFSFYFTLSFIESLHKDDDRLIKQSKSAALICLTIALLLPAIFGLILK